jgi:hypothetical protein
MQPKLRSKHNNGEMIEKTFYWQHHAAIIDNGSIFLAVFCTNMTSFLCNWRNSRKQARTAFRFLLKCQNTWPTSTAAPSTRNHLEDIFRSSESFRSALIRSALTTIKLAIFNGNSLFLLVHGAYIAFMLLLLRHTCITFLLIGFMKAVLKEMCILLPSPLSISAREWKTEQFQCASTWMKMKMNWEVTSQHRRCINQCT